MFEELKSEGENEDFGEIEIVEKEKIPKTSDYIMLKRCVNCSTNNKKTNNSCVYCKMLLVKELTYEEWVKINTASIKKE